MFERIRQFLAQASEVGRFKRLIAELSPRDLTIDAAAARTLKELAGGRSRQDALDEFADRMASREAIAPILANHGYRESRAKTKLIELYWTLLTGGAGQCVGKTYVATAALYDPALLSLLLDAETRLTERGANPREIATDMAWTAIDCVMRQEHC